MATLKYWLWLTGRRGLGNAGALRVLDHFVTPERAFYADPEEYALVEDLTPAACAPCWTRTPAGRSASWRTAPAWTCGS